VAARSVLVRAADADKDRAMLAMLCGPVLERLRFPLGS
jgi:hypothetical protein